MDVAHLLGDLDEQQRAAVTTPSTLVAVIAAAGSGKTRVLARRIAYRVADETADARHTLALTFTREAAGELRRRLRSAGLRDHVDAGTFHSVALGLLRQRAIDSGRPLPTIVAERDRLLAEVAGGVSVDALSTERTWLAARGVPSADYVATARAANRRTGIPAQQIAAALEAYDLLKHRRGVIDLDDVLLRLSHALATDAAFAAATRWRFRHLLVDEAQDLNPVQHRLLRQLAADRRDLFLVGDPAQAIYAFNGSDPTLLTDVDRHLPGIEVVSLPTNRRCTPQIVTAGRQVLESTGQGSIAVSARADGEVPELLVGIDEHDEAQRVVAYLRRVSHDRLARGDVAVLARTHEQLAGLRRALRRAGVPERRVAIDSQGPLGLAVRSAGFMTSAAQLRAWAHDVLETTPEMVNADADERQQADRRVAACVLDFLREQPSGDGFALRGWIASTNPLRTPEDGVGVDLLTFHAAKGREWHTVVVTGVETGLVPHRSATTMEGRAEEARLLHVAITRASDVLVISRAERRRGYTRQASPFLAALNVEPFVPVAPPPELRVPPDPVRLRKESLLAWRTATARATAMLAEQVCSDDDLSAIAAAPPATPEELSAVTGFGPIAAARLFSPIRRALDDGATRAPADASSDVSR